MVEQTTFSDVFISYSRRDRAFVTQLNNAFKARELEVWIDSEDIPFSVDWWKAIKAGIESANTVVFVISPDSVQSEVCTAEIKYALQQNKRLIPILYRDVSGYENHIHTAIKTHNWIFFRPEDDFDAAFEHLIETMNADFSHVREHTRLLTRAHDWEQNDWNNDYLLTGAELEDALHWLTNARKEEKEPPPTSLHEQFIETSRSYKGKRQRRLIAGVATVIAFALLATFALFQSNQAQNNANLAATNEAVAEANADEARANANIAATNEALAEQEAATNAANARAISLSLHAETLATNGFTYAALPFALAAYAIEPDNQGPIANAQVVLSRVALQPGAMNWLTAHDKEVTDIAAHPSELQVVTASRDNTLNVWDFSTDDPILKFTLGVPDSEIENADDLLAEMLPYHVYDVRAVIFSVDGTVIYSGSNDGRIIAWDAETGAYLYDLMPQPITDTDVDQLAVSNDGRYLMASIERLNGTVSNYSDDTYEIHIYDLETRQLVQMVGGSGVSVGSVVFSPDSSRFLVGNTNGEIVVYPLEPQSEVYLPYAGTFITGDTNIDNIDDEEDTLFAAPLAFFEVGDDDPVEAMDFNADGTLLASAVRYDIYLWDWAQSNSDEALVGVLPNHTDFVTGLAFLPESDALFSTSRDRNMILWDVPSRVPETIMTAHETLPSALAVTYDGRFGVTGARTNGIAILWDLQVVGFQNSFASRTEEVRRVVYHPSGQYAASISSILGDDNAVGLALWHPSTGERILTFPDHTFAGRDLGFVLDGRAIVTSRNTSIYLWHAELYSDGSPTEDAGSQLDMSEPANTSAIFDLAIRPDGRQVLAATSGGDVFIWDILLEDGAPLTEARLSEPRVITDIVGGQRLLTVEYNPHNPNQAFISSNRAVFALDLTTEAGVASFVGHTESVVGMAVNAAQNLLVTTDFRRDVYVWDFSAVTEREAGDFAVEPQSVLTFHQAAVWGVDIAPNGRFVATAAENGEVLVWDLTINALVRRFDGYPSRIRSVAFSPDGESIFFGEETLHHVQLYTGNATQITDWIADNRIVDIVSCPEQFQLLINPECAPDRPVLPIVAGTPETGSVHLESTQRWRYTGRAGEVITIEVVADNPLPGQGFDQEERRANAWMDTYLTVFNSDGSQLAFNDDVDWPNNYNSAIYDLTLPTDGDYIFEVSTFANGSYGTYTITVTQISLPPEATPEATENP